MKQFLSIAVLAFELTLTCASAQAETLICRGGIGQAGQAEELYYTTSSGAWVFVSFTHAIVTDPTKMLAGQCAWTTRVMDNTQDGTFVGIPFNLLLDPNRQYPGGQNISFRFDMFGSGTSTQVAEHGDGVTGSPSKFFFPPSMRCGISDVMTATIFDPNYYWYVTATPSTSLIVATGYPLFAQLGL